jgi:hypothetical protein
MNKISKKKMKNHKIKKIMKKKKISTFQNLIIEAHQNCHPKRNRF